MADGNEVGSISKAETDARSTAQAEAEIEKAFLYRRNLRSLDLARPPQPPTVAGRVSHPVDRFVFANSQTETAGFPPLFATTPRSFDGSNWMSLVRSRRCAS